MRKNARSVLVLMVGFALFLAPAAGARVVQAAQQDAEIRPGVLLVGMRAADGPRVMSLPGTASYGDTSPELQKLNVVRIEVPEGEEETYRAKLLEDPLVIFAEPDYRVKADLIPDDTRWSEQYGPANVRAPEAWDITTGSSSVIVAVLDSGVDAGHPDLAGRLIAGRDFVENDSTPQDKCGHGTHVTGILAANGNNNRGVAGMDWQAKVMPVRVLGGECEGWISDVVAGLVWATDHGARIINMSIGTSSDSTLFQNGTYYAYQHGAALFAAGGNAGISNLYYPARYPWVMAVGAVNRNNLHAPFSNRSDKQADMLVSAPGVQILSTTPRTSFYYQWVFGTTLTYGYLSGTSMASPHAAGAAALLASQPQFDSPDKIYQALYQTALDLGPAGYDPEYGYGLIQVDAALAFTDFSPTPPFPDVANAYDFVTSKDCGNLPYEWVDATADGSRLPVFGTDGWARVDLPFTFNFAGTDYNSMAVSANGYVTFDLPKGIYSERDNFLIPGFAQPNNFIAPFWDDLNPSEGGFIYQLEQPGAFVIEWWEVPHQGYTENDSLLTFEVILYQESNEILFQYHTLVGPYARGSSATVGLEYGDGYGGTQYSYEQSSLSEGMAILFVPSGSETTRNIRNCLFTTTSQFNGCSQLDPFGVDIFSGLIPPPPPQTVLEMQRVENVPGWPSNLVSMGEYVEITLTPSPPTPFNPEAMVCYRYTTEDVLRAGGHVNNLFLATYSGGKWQKLSTAVDTANSRLMAPVEHFSLFGVFSALPQQLPVTGADYRLLIGLGCAVLAVLCLAGWTLRRR